jgi:hypothetical protein
MPNSRFWLTRLAFLSGLLFSGPFAARGDAYASAILTDEPAAYFRLGEAAGVYYSLVNGHTGTVVGSASRGGAGPGCRNASMRGARLFDGLEPDNATVYVKNALQPQYGVGTEFIRVPDSPGLNPGTNGLTLEAWVYLPSLYTVAGDGLIIAKLGTPEKDIRVGYSLATRLENESLCVYGRLIDQEAELSAFFDTPFAAIATGAWHHVAAVFQRNPPGTQDLASIYVNGVLRGTTTGSLSKVGNVIDGQPEDIKPTAPLGIGAGIRTNGTVLGYALHGSVDEAAVYGRALGWEAVSNHYEAAAGTRRGTTTVPVTENLLAALQSVSSITSSTGRVAVWVDEAPGGGYQDFVQIVAAYRPSRTQIAMPNSRPLAALDFNSAAQQYLELQTNAAMNTNTLTWFVVFKPDVTNAIQVVTRTAYTSGAGPSGSPSLWGTYAQINTAINTYSRQVGGTMGSGVLTPADATGWLIASGAWNGTNVAVNGVAAKTMTARLRDPAGTVYAPASATGLDANPAGHLRTRVGLSSTVASPYPFVGKIAEVLIYTTALSASDVAAVEQYLASKYFIPAKGTLMLVR